MKEVSEELWMEYGLSLKRAAKIADAAARCNIRGVINSGGRTCNIGSVLQMASSGINEGEAVRVVCRGERAQEALEVITGILTQPEE